MKTAELCQTLSYQLKLELQGSIPDYAPLSGLYSKQW